MSKFGNFPENLDEFRGEKGSFPFVAQCYSLVNATTFLDFVQEAG